MKRITSILTAFVMAVMLLSCGQKKIENETVGSPNGKFKIAVSTEKGTGQLVYQVFYMDEEVVKTSKLGFLLAGGDTLGTGLAIQSVVQKTVQQSWKPLYGERNEYPENYSESLLVLADAVSGEVKLNLEVRAYDEGVAFRYGFPGQGEVKIVEELTQFSLDPNAKAWATPMSQGTIAKVSVADITERTERPLLVQNSETQYLAIGEAAQIDYARMKLIGDGSGVLQASLGSEVVDTAPFNTPWRFIMAGRSAGELLEKNYLILNLNEPSKIEDTSWIKPGKVIRDLTLTTDGAKAFIDFAVKHNLQYVIESAGWYGDEFTKEADASTVTVDPKRSTGPLDMQEVIRYGKEKGIDIMVYVNRNQMEKQLDQILPLYEEWGIKGIKYGFVRTGDQKWSSWMHEAVRKAADHKMVLSIHDDYRPVGYTRTYPNLMTQEGIRGDEESPTNEHTLKTMFTRMLAGAGDNTVCYFAPRVEEMGSHASQLAKSVCLYSPLLWLYWYDRPIEAGFKSGGAGNSKSVIEEVPELEFFDKLPTVWDETKVIHSEVGVLGTIARRNGDNWFVGSMNGPTDRLLSIPLNFLESGKEYEATIFYDDENVKTVTRVGVEKMVVTNKTEIIRDVFNNNGVAILLTPKK